MRRSYSFERYLGAHHIVVVHMVPDEMIRALVYIERVDDGAIVECWGDEYRSLLLIWQDVLSKVNQWPT